MKFGELIKGLRKRPKRISQVDLANKLDVWQSYINQIESGARLPSPERTVEIAKALAVEKQDLLDALAEEKVYARSGSTGRIDKIAKKYKIEIVSNTNK